MQDLLLTAYKELAELTDDPAIIQVIETTHAEMLARRHSIFIDHVGGKLDEDQYESALQALDDELAMVMDLTEEQIERLNDDKRRAAYAQRERSNARMHKFLVSQSDIVPRLPHIRLADSQLAMLTVMITRANENLRLRGAKTLFVKILGLNERTVRRNMKVLTEMGLIQKYSRRIKRGMNTPNLITLVHKALIAKAEYHMSRKRQIFSSSRGGIDTSQPSVLKTVTTAEGSSESSVPVTKIVKRCRQKAERYEGAKPEPHFTQSDGLEGEEFSDLVASGLDYMGLEVPDARDEDTLLTELRELFERKYQTFNRSTLSYLRYRYSERHVLTCMLANLMTKFSRNGNMHDGRPKNELVQIKKPDAYLFSTITAATSRPVSTIVTMLENRNIYHLSKQLREIAAARFDERERMAA